MRNNSRLADLFGKATVVVSCSGISFRWSTWVRGRQAAVGMHMDNLL